MDQLRWILVVCTVILCIGCGTMQSVDRPAQESADKTGAAQSDSIDAAKRADIGRRVAWFAVGAASAMVSRDAVVAAYDLDDVVQGGGVEYKSYRDRKYAVGFTVALAAIASLSMALANP